MTIDQKPILHGRDHSPGGADPIPDLGGIQFDTYPQAGQWLYIETDGADTSPSGFGMEFYDQGANGIDMASDGCHLRLNDFGSSDTELTSGGDLTLSGGDSTTVGAANGLTLTTHGTLLIEAVSVFMTDADVHITAGNSVVIDSEGTATMTIDSTVSPDWLLFSQAPTVRLAYNDSSVFFRIEDITSQPLLEVRGDGTFHILTGATWVADL